MGDIVLLILVSEASLMLSFDCEVDDKSGLIDCMINWLIGINIILFNPVSTPVVPLGS